MAQRVWFNSNRRHARDLHRKEGGLVLSSSAAFLAIDNLALKNRIGVVTRSVGRALPRQTPKRCAISSTAVIIHQHKSVSKAGMAQSRLFHRSSASVPGSSRSSAMATPSTVPRMSQHISRPTASRLNIQCVQPPSTDIAHNDYVSSRNKFNRPFQETKQQTLYASSVQPGVS